MRPLSLNIPLDVRLMNVTASFMFGGVCLLVMVMVVGWVLRHPVFSISRIVVEGELVHNNAVTLRANVAPHLAGNFFTIDLAQAQDVFEQVPWVRKAQVRRAYPNSLRVILYEHVAQAYWGEESGAAMVNTHGEVFEANLGELEREGMPRLMGPSGSAPEVLRMLYALEPLLGALERKIDALTLRDRGSWELVLDNGARIELGAGGVEEVLQRVQRLARTLPGVLHEYQRSSEALEYADLRYPDGYALRLSGVATISREAAKAMAARAAAAARKQDKKNHLRTQ
ncbi:MAG: cell division protein FtsQ/DivIB [Comamonas sp.]|jgi:cell division protein FtsQ|nr:cell division protein FtsQ/DivIB [Comamonas sp.]